MTPKISVVMPCFNTADFLPKALASLESQTFKPSEIIIVDDGSSDNIKEVVSKNKKLIYVCHSKNRGLSAAKNTGAKYCHGDYIFFAESDAYYFPECLEELVKKLESNPRASFSYSDFVFKNLTGGKDKHINAGDFDKMRLRSTSYISGCSLVRRKDYLAYDEEIKRFTDWDYYLKATEADQTGVYVPKTLFWAYLRAGGVSSQGSYNQEYWRLKVQEKHGLAPKVAVYTFTRDRLDYTRRTFAGLRKLGFPFDHFIIDNASSDGTKKWLKKYQRNSGNKVIVVESKINLGIAGAKNKVIKKIGANYDYILKLDNDCEIKSENILSELIILSRVYKDKVVLSPKVEGLRRPVPRYAYIKIGPHVMSPVPLIGGIFCFSPNKYYKNFSSNPAFRVAKGDPEFAAHVWKSGGKMYYVEDLVVEHMDTSEGQVYRYPEYLERKNKELEVQKKVVFPEGYSLEPVSQNALYWQEVYRVNKNWHFAALSIAARLGFLGKVLALTRILKRLHR